MMLMVETNTQCLICREWKNLEKEFYDMAICKDCIHNNKDVFDITKEPEKFKKELMALFYVDTFEHWFVHVEERDFIFKRWGIFK